jgi:hypothetical protein
MPGEKTPCFQMSPHPLFSKGSGDFSLRFSAELLWPRPQVGLNVGPIDDLAGIDAVLDDALLQEKVSHLLNHLLL